MCISNLFGGCGNNGCTWILFLIVLVLTLAVFKSSALWVFYEGEVKNK